MMMNDDDDDNDNDDDNTSSLGGALTGVDLGGVGLEVVYEGVRVEVITL